MNKMKTQKLALTAMMIALTTVGTLFLRIPGIVPNGYVNFGDTFLMFAGLLLGPMAGFAAGSLGSALADIISGYAFYAPITFVVKGLEGFVCGGLYKKMNQKYASLATLVAGVLMVAGYFIGESVFLYGVKGAAADIFGNALQGITNAVFATLLNRTLSGTLKKILAM